MSEVIDLLNNHRSIRKFKDEPLSDDTIRQLVGAAQSASTSNYIQAYSIIGVKDKEKKKALEEISTQPYVYQNGHLFIFVMDFNRHYQLSQSNDKAIQYDSTENTLVGVIDAALASQNLAIAAESLGLGIVYLGSLRNDVQKVIEILKLPEGVFPLFGMAVGTPDHNGSKKERLPFEAVYFEDEYKPMDDNLKRVIDEYDLRISEYYNERTDGKRNDKWSEQVTEMLSKKMRLDVTQIIKNQGFLKK